MPHALLFHGQSGIGKVAFARHLAQSLLCENPGIDGHACGQCISCGWVSQRSHPDYRIVRPEVLDIAEGLEEAEDGSDPDAEAVDADGKKSRRAPSKEIRIEQVRQLTSLLSVGTHRGGVRVVLVYPVQAMNTFTANALLKMLEEPPANTVFLLVTDSLERVLPTILSRCRKLAVPPPSFAQSLEWLKAAGVDDAERLLAEQGGAPLAALAASQDGAVELAGMRDRLFEQLRRPETLDAVIAAERLAKCELTIVAGWLQRWVYDCMGYRLAGRIRYYPSQQTHIAALSARLDLRRMLEYGTRLTAERRVAEHPLNARLYIENLLIGYAKAAQPG